MAKFTGSLEQKQLKDLLRQLRLDAGLKQAELANLLGQSQSYVSKYESGERRLDFLEVRHVCKVLGTSITDFARKVDNLINES